MAACLKPINLKTVIRRDTLLYNYVPNINIYCNISKNRLFEIIKYTFIESCNLSVVGFNNQTEEFWGKKFKHNNYLLHFTLIIKSIDCNNSFIIISPLVGDNNEIVKLINNTIQIINLYKQDLYFKS